MNLKESHLSSTSVRRKSFAVTCDISTGKYNLHLVTSVGDRNLKENRILTTETKDSSAVSQLQSVKFYKNSSIMSISQSNSPKFEASELNFTEIQTQSNKIDENKCLKNSNLCDASEKISAHQDFNFIPSSNAYNKEPTIVSLQRSIDNSDKLKVDSASNSNSVDGIKCDIVRNKRLFDGTQKQVPFHSSHVSDPSVSVSTVNDASSCSSYVSVEKACSITISDLIKKVLDGEVYNSTQNHCHSLHSVSQKNCTCINSYSSSEELKNVSSPEIEQKCESSNNIMHSSITIANLKTFNNSAILKTSAADVECKVNKITPDCDTPLFKGNSESISDSRKNIHLEKDSGLMLLADSASNISDMIRENMLKEPGSDSSNCVDLFSNALDLKCCLKHDVSKDNSEKCISCLSSLDFDSNQVILNERITDQKLAPYEAENSDAHINKGEFIFDKRSAQVNDSLRLEEGTSVINENCITNNVDSNKAKDKILCAEIENGDCYGLCDLPFDENIPVPSSVSSPNKEFILNNAHLSQSRNDVTYDKLSYKCKTSVLQEKCEFTHQSTSSEYHFTVTEKSTMIQTGTFHSTPNVAPEKPKVLVQMLPVINVDFGRISAFQGDSKHRLNKNFSVRHDNNVQNIMKPDNLCKAYKEVEKETLNVLEVSSDSRASEKSSHDVKKSYCEDRALKFHIYPGKGIKLKRKKIIVRNLKKASESLLRLLHYVLYGSYGQCKTEALTRRTIKNILRFSGFVFDRSSMDFQKKQMCLTRIPFPILIEMYNNLVGGKCQTRSDVVESLLDFLMKPEDNEISIKEKVREESEILKLKSARLEEQILKGPVPIVALSRLSESYIEKMITKVEKQIVLRPDNSIVEAAIHSKPVYILSGPGVALKTFPRVSLRVSRASKEVISLLHFILYGRTENVALMRQNILEFSGFCEMQKDFVIGGREILSSMPRNQLQQLCEIFFLRSRSGSKNEKIKKLLKFLSSPSHFSSRDCKLKDIFEQDEEKKFKKYSKKEDTNLGRSHVPSLPKLGDFKKIHSNVECATPSDLMELNDLLFIKPSDDSDIHQKILDFAQFTFSDNSMEYQYRKTLLHYMSFEVVRKISRLLNIPNWEKCTNKEDLSSSVLKFLMEMKEEKRDGQHIAKQFMSPLDVENNFEKKVDSSIIDHGYSTDTHIEQSKVFEESAMEYKKTIHIHQMSVAAQPPKGFSRTEDLDDFLPLRDILCHPTDVELEQVIESIIKSELWSLTMGGLVKLVLQQYPNIDLTYRIDFIKSKARNILSELRKSAVKSLGC